MNRLETIQTRLILTEKLLKDLDYGLEKSGI